MRTYTHPLFLVNIIILYQFVFTEKVNSFFSQIQEFYASVLSGELSAEALKARINSLEDEIQIAYDDWADYLDLDSIEDPDHPEIFPGYQFMGSYERSILILPEENMTISIKIRRIRPRSGQGPTHALLPWFLCAYSRRPVWIDVYFLLTLFETLKEEGTPHSCALDLGISPLYLYLIQKKQREFASLPNVPDLSWETVWDWLVLSIVRLRHIWTGSLHSFRDRILLAGLIF